MRLHGIGAMQILDPSIVQQIASVIQDQEGYYPGSLAYQNNNPGNLIYAGQTGATQGAGGFAKFPTYDAGLQALYNQIQLYASRGMTIQDMMNVYAPAGQGNNDPVAYAQTIANAVGATPDTLLTAIGSGPTNPEAGVIYASTLSNPGTLMVLGAATLAGIYFLSR